MNILCYKIIQQFCNCLNAMSRVSSPPDAYLFLDNAQGDTSLGEHGKWKNE